MVCVIDCSFIMAVAMPDERSALVCERFDAIERDAGELLVPHLWWLETTNVLMNAIRRGRLTLNDALERRKLIDSYNFSTDQAYGAEYGGRLLALCALHDLSAYDAAYLELAIRKKARLATLDVRLKRSAEASGLSVI
ncbi:twitching motility protein PilT [Campylobacterota bacterium]|nr:twitching motility protein PilT [Campylobacterota bacterium]